MDIVVQIQEMLGDRAVVTFSEGKIIIKTPPLANCCSGYYLEKIADKRWNGIKIDKSIEVVLIGWLIDKNKGNDLWCFEWMQENYNIIDMCERC